MVPKKYSQVHIHKRTVIYELLDKQKAHVACHDHVAQVMSSLPTAYRETLYWRRRGEWKSARFLQ